MLNITARKHRLEAPVIVQLSQARVQHAAGHLLTQIISALENDDGLDKVLALTSLLTTMLHMTARCDIYKKFPYTLWKLTKTHNIGGYLDECAAFLEKSTAELDKGSLQIL